MRATAALRSATAAGVAVLLAGCSAGPPTATAGSAAATADPAAASSAVRKGFPAGASVDYQLGGAYAVPRGVGIVVRDSTDAPAPGVWSVCYVNGFQTQPGEAARWSGSRARLLLRDADGDPVVDPDWPDEVLLDSGSNDKRVAIAEVLQADLRRCRARGFDAVEIDNLDSFTRATGLSEAGNTALAVLYARRAHALGLSIGQKNAAEYSARLHRRVGFDFAVAEECVSYQECAAYTDVYGEAVIDVEYSDDRRVSLKVICADSSRPASTVLRDRELLPAASPGHVNRRC
jgi:hypothetical protein